MDLSIFLNQTAGVVAEFTTFFYGSPWGIVILFFFTLFANASIVLPILVEPIVLAVAVFAPNPWYVLGIGIVTGTAAAIGEMSGYVVGTLGINRLKKMKKERVEKIFEIGEKLANKGMPIIFIASFTPIPFDIVGIAAGIIKYNIKKFFLATLAGKLLRYTLVAFVGYIGIELVREMFPWIGTIMGI